MYRLKAIVQLMRPHQWAKNVFVFIGLIFGHAWMDMVMLTAVAWAFVAFCLLSSSVYVLNDILDRNQDRQHHKKKHRPIAAGLISLPVAYIIAVVLGCVALSIAYWVHPSVLLLMVLYVLLNIGYSMGLKHIVIIDVFIIAAGFMLRILVGTVGVGIPPSQWLILCGLMFTLFLGFAKRRAEFVLATEGSQKSRRVLTQYDVPLLDTFIAVSATCTVITYGLYTVSDSTLQTHGTPNLVYTLPFVLYGVFRYIYRVHRYQHGEDPATEVFTDVHMVATLLLWAVSVMWLIA